MIVKHLIERLQRQPQDAEVWLEVVGHTARAIGLGPTSVVLLNCSPTGRPARLVLLTDAPEDSEHLA